MWYRREYALQLRQTVIGAGTLFKCADEDQQMRINKLSRTLAVHAARSDGGAGEWVSVIEMEGVVGGRKRKADSMW